MRTNQIVHRCIRQTVVGKGRVCASELQITVRADIGGAEWVSVEVEREGQSNGCRAIIGMIACVDRAQNDRASPGCGGIIGAGLIWK